MKKIAIALMLLLGDAFCLNMDPAFEEYESIPSGLSLALLKECKQVQSKLVEQAEPIRAILEKISADSNYVFTEEEKITVCDNIIALNLFFSNYIEFILRAKEDDLEFICYSLVVQIKIALYERFFDKVDAADQRAFLSTLDNLVVNSEVRAILLNRGNYECESFDAGEHPSSDFADVLRRHRSGYPNIEAFVAELEKI